MKKKVMVSSLVLVLLIGVGTGAYWFYDYREHKPLILECKAPKVMHGDYIIKIEPSVSGWRYGPAHGLGSRPTYWNAQEEQWEDFQKLYTLSDSFLESDKNKFEWIASEDRVMRVDRNSGDFLILRCPSSMQMSGRCENEFGQKQDLRVLGRGSCRRTDEPKKKLKQKF